MTIHIRVGLPKTTASCWFWTKPVSIVRLASYVELGTSALHRGQTVAQAPYGTPGADMASIGADSTTMKPFDQPLT